MSPLSASPALLKAYAELPEEAKRRFWRVWYREEPEWVAGIVKSLDLLRGFRLGSVLERKLPVHRKKLDAALSGSSMHQLDALPHAARIFCVAERSNWIDDVGCLLTGATERDIASRLTTALDTVGRAARTDPLWDLFRARSELTPNGWLPPPTTDVAAPALLPDSEEATPDAKPDDRWLAIDRTANELSMLIDAARNARPVTLPKAQQLLNELAVQGQQLREELETMAHALGKVCPSWQLLSELQDLTHKLRQEGVAAKRAEGKARLTALAVALSSISGLNISSRSKREKLLMVCATVTGRFKTSHSGSNQNQPL